MTDKPTSVIRETNEDAIRLAKTLLRTARYGALATLDPEAGSPIATRVGTATDFDGTPLLLISGLTAHFSALKADPRCSLLLGEPGKGDPLAHPRITIAAEAQFIERDAEENARINARYLRHHPKARLYAGLGDFRYVRLAPISASLNGGFGKAYRLTPDDLIAPPNPALAAAEASALEHMNTDHPAAVALYARHYASATQGKWELIGLDADGMTLKSGDDFRRVSFDTPAERPEHFHTKLVAMAQQARKAMGEP